MAPGHSTLAVPALALGVAFGTGAALVFPTLGQTPRLGLLCLVWLWEVRAASRNCNFYLYICTLDTLFNIYLLRCMCGHKNIWFFFPFFGFKRWATVCAGCWCEDQHWAGLRAGVGRVGRTKPILNVERIGHLSWYPGKGLVSIFSAAAESLQPTSLWALGPGLWLGSTSGHPIHLPPLAHRFI